MLFSLRLTPCTQRLWVKRFCGVDTTVIDQGDIECYVRNDLVDELMASGQTIEWIHVVYAFDCRSLACLDRLLPSVTQCEFAEVRHVICSSGMECLRVVALRRPQLFPLAELEPVDWMEMVTAAVAQPDLEIVRFLLDKLRFSIHVAHDLFSCFS